MTFVPMARTTITCQDVPGACLLGAQLQSPAAWAGSPRPDLVEVTGAEVTLSWWTQPVAIPQASVSPALLTTQAKEGGATIVHTTGGVTGKPVVL
jgi:hypothetical protein